MKRKISPPLEELSSLRTPLTVGERKVLDLFNEKLSEDWEIYIQPHLNGLRPDFVLLNPNVGIAIFEVKDWDLKAMPYRVEYSAQNYPELWSTNKHGIPFRVPDNPVEKVVQYKETLIELYCPRLANNRAKDFIYSTLVTAGVIMTKATTAEAQKLLQVFHKDAINNSNKSQQYYPIVGQDELEKKNINAIFPNSRWHTSKYMTSEIANDLRHWLIEPDFASTQRQPLELNPKQKNLIKTRTETGYRRIKGAAGSGKSLVLAGRAAQLSAEEKDILVVTFNITLWHYLRDLAVRHQIEGKKINSITWCHFHEWCKRVCFDAGFENEYRQLWKKLPDLDKNNQELYNKILENILEIEIPNLVKIALQKEENYIPTFDAILVDEGQDYNLDWWNLLRKVLRKNGEMLLVADETQDIYGQAKYWTDDKMLGAGFRGDWSTLDICYRIPPTLIKYLEDYTQKYLPNKIINLPESEQNELDVYPIKMRWIQIEHQNTAQICSNVILNLPTLVEPDLIAYPDIVFLVQNHKKGLEIVKILEEKNVKVAHTFGKEYQEKKYKKLGFFMGDARVKASTIHSFKGWEAPYMVINIDSLDRDRLTEELSLIYVALSRLKRRTEGSYLTVICSDPYLEDFGKTWENFEKINN